MSQTKIIESTVFLRNNDLIRAALKSKLESVTTMPTLSEDIVGTAYLYTGTTTADFTENTIYKAISDSGDPATLSWQTIELGSTTISDVSVLPTGSSIDDIFYRLLTPTPYTVTVDADFLDDNTNFTKTSNTYTAQSGVNINVSLDNGTTYKDFTSLEFDGTDWTLTADGETATLNDGDTFYYQIVSYSLYAGNSEKQITERIALYEDLPDGVIVDSSLSDSSENPVENKAITTALNTKLTQYITMPEATIEYTDKIIQYIGATSADYIQGYFYTSVVDDDTTDPATYKWVQVVVQDEATPHWSGTKAEYETVKDSLSIGTYVSFTDDVIDADLVNELIENSTDAITSGAVYDAINVIKTDSITLTLGSGDNATISVNLYKNGHTVIGTGFAQSDPSKIEITQGSWFTIGTLPEGFRPKNKIFIPLTHSNSRNVECLIQILNSGTISMYKYTSGNLGYERAVNFSFIVD